jgi:cellulose biosynthesis protein BcsQ
MPHGKIIALLNSKGGVGKSTLAWNLAAFFHRHGLTTKIVDCDYRQLTLKRNFERVQSGGNRPADSKGKFEWPTFEGFPVEMASPRAAGRCVLYDLEKDYRSTRDIVILDCGPSVMRSPIGENTLRQMAADVAAEKSNGIFQFPESQYDEIALACVRLADLTVVPVAPAQQDLEATRIILQTLRNPALALPAQNRGMCVFNLAKASIKEVGDAKKLGKDLDYIREVLGFEFFNTVIHRYESFVNANNDGYSVLTRFEGYKKQPTAVSEILALGQEVLSQLAVQAPKEMVA